MTSAMVRSACRLGAAVALIAAGCAPAQDAAESSDPPANVVRTADPSARGLTDADFPRLQQLADGVYSYEQLRSAGDEKFTTVSLFVVTSDGVLVADGRSLCSRFARRR